MVFRAIALTLALIVLVTAPALAEERPTGKPAATVSIHQLSVAFIGSGAVGGGTLHYDGHSYPLTVNGLGVGGIGASQLSASGDVYGLTTARTSPALMRNSLGWALGKKAAEPLAAERQGRHDETADRTPRPATLARRRRRDHRVQVTLRARFPPPAIEHFRPTATSRFGLEAGGRARSELDVDQVVGVLFHLEGERAFSS